MAKSKSKGKWLRILGWMAGGIAIGVAVLAICTWAAINPIIMGAVPAIGSKVTGTEVTLGGVDLSLLRGSLELRDFVVGNPEGYNTPNLMSVGRIYVKLDLLSVFSDTVHIQAIEILDPVITYEVGMGNSNVGMLLKHLDGGGGPAADSEESAERPSETPTAADAGQGGGKKVVIDQVSVKGGSVHLSAKLMQGTAVPVPLPPITINGIGKSGDDGRADEGASLVEAGGRILKSICASAVDVAGKAWSGLVDVGKSAGKAIGEAGKAAGKAIDEAAGAVKKLFTE